MRYDVVVVGLGPGGASASYYASRNGVKTLGVEKRREIGIPIQCGEFLPREDMYSEILPNSTHTFLLKNFPDEIIRNRTSRVSMFSPKGIEYIDDFNGYVIDRSLFDKWIVSKAVEEGADIRIETSVYDIKKVEGGYKVMLRGPIGREEVETKTLVIAAGASSHLIEKVDLMPERSDENLGHVIQYVMVNVSVDQEKIEMYSGKKYCPGAYAWIIPRGDNVANVGLGIRRSYVSKGDEGLSIRDFLHRFIYEHPIASKKVSMGKAVSVVGGLVPVGPPLKSVGDNVVLVGDSANHVIASVGAGIPTSVIAGSIAGETIAEFLAGDVSLSEYERRWKIEMGDALENGYRIRLIIDVLCRSDFILENGLKLFGKEHFSDLIRARLPTGAKFLTWVQKIAKSI